MQKLMFILSILLSVNSHSQKEFITIDGYTVEAFAGPNMLRVAENFYADQTEITNSFYKEYMHWIKTVFGITSNEYINCIPDASVWHYQNQTKLTYDEYFLAPELNKYPLVGISLQQAKDYANWRTERVAEMLLIEQGILNPNKNCNRDNYFSIEKFRNGTYPLRNKDKLKSIFVFPRFAVPSASKWDLLAGADSEFSFGINQSEAHNINILKNGSKLINIDIDDGNSEINDSSHCPILSSQNGCKNIYGLLHVYGNVAELVLEEGIAKGGDWKHTIKDISKQSNKKQNIPNCWTGFRCISKLEIVEHNY